MADDSQLKRVEVQFNQLCRQLITTDPLTEKILKSMSLPSQASDFVPRLWEMGIDDLLLARALAAIYKCPLFNGEIISTDKMLRSSNDQCPWLIGDNVLYVTNPYDRSQIEPLMRRKKDARSGISFASLGIIAMSDFDADFLVQANYDQGVETHGHGGAWAKEFIDELISEAVNRRASDIHINPESHGGIVRLRIDGRCETSNIAGLQTISKERFKLVANNLMDRAGKQNNYLEPASGYMIYQAAHKQISLRLEMAPVKVLTRCYPKLTLRILNNQKGLSRLDQLGLSETHVAKLRELAHRPNGLIIITGPTGSGKSTTLKVLLRDIRDYFPEKAVYTIEDPVEDQLDGIVSLEVNRHLSFSQALRSLLRHDPDVIMIGEIRDGETAELAMRAAMTGHLVLTTLHTNDAHGAINRLQDLGVDAPLLAENLLAVTAQRLVNKVCPMCVRKVPLNGEHNLYRKYKNISALVKPQQKIPQAAKGDACDNCNNGYVGRQLANELFVNNDMSEVMITHGKTGREIKAAQWRAGQFKDMWEDGVRLVIQGDVSLEALEAKLNPLSAVRDYQYRHNEPYSDTMDTNSLKERLVSDSSKAGKPEPEKIEDAISI